MSTIERTPFDSSPYCTGFSWTILDQDGLARLVAEILVARHEHALALVRSEPSGRVSANPSVIRSVLKHKLRSPKTEAERYHRDGLLFQHIAWIAAAQTVSPGDLLSVPQSRMSDKGQDMLIVHCDNSGNTVIGVTICEQKATERGRRTMRAKVLPEIADYESGSRDDELESATIAILREQRDRQSAERLVEAVFWKDTRRYRVSITTTADEDTPAGRALLFSGYEIAAPGNPARRKSDLLSLQDLRAWFDAFARLVRKHVTALGQRNV